MTDELKVFSLICSVRCTINSNGLPATFCVPKKRTKRKSVLPATATYYGSIVLPRHDGRQRQALLLEPHHQVENGKEMLFA